MNTAKITGFASGIVDILLLQTMATNLDTITRAALYALSAAIVTVLTTKLVAALTRLTELPSKEEWKEFGDKIDSVSSKLDNHISGYTEWKDHVNKTLDN